MSQHNASSSSTALVVAHDLAKTFDVSAPWITRVIERKPRQLLKAVDGVSFELKQFHFHVPSENHINGKSYPMEAHLVHADKDNHLAVVAVMFEAGQPNALLDKVWQQAPDIGGKASLTTDLPAAALLPSERDYYRFNGSLTTPPCSEGVRWLVLKQPVTASNAQLKQLVHHIHHENNRPLQAVNARVILQ